MSAFVGYIFAFLALAFIGSFMIFSKFEKVKSSNTSPIIFNLYFAFGIILSSVIVYIILLFLGNVIEFTYLGIISGLILVISIVFVFISIEKIGISYGICIWCGGGVITSFLEGLMISSNDIKLNNVYLTVIALIIILSGIIGVTFSRQLVEKLSKVFNISLSVSSENVSENDEHFIDVNDVSNSYSRENDSLLPKVNEPVNKSYISNSDWTIGIIYSVIVSVMAGTQALPVTWTSAEGNNNDLKFLISFAVGVVLIYPLTLIYYMIINYNNLSNLKSIKFNMKTCFIPGTLSGIVFNLGFICQIYGIKYIGYVVCTPIQQSNLIIGILWGIFVFKEITNKHIIISVVLFAAVVILGCALLAYGVNG